MHAHITRKIRVHPRNIHAHSTWAPAPPGTGTAADVPLAGASLPSATAAPLRAPGPLPRVGMLSPGAADRGAGGSAWSAPNGDSGAVEKGDARSGADALACPRGHSLAALGACRRKGQCCVSGVEEHTDHACACTCNRPIAEGTRGGVRDSGARHGVMSSIPGSQMYQDKENHLCSARLQHAAVFTVHLGLQRLITGCIGPTCTGH